MGGASEVRTMCVPIVIPQTHYKKGEILRLTIEGWIKKDGAGTSLGTVSFDPQNRDGTLITPSTDTDVTTISTFHCPFRLDL